MSEIPTDLAAKIAAIKAKMQGTSVDAPPASGAAPAAPAAETPAAAAGGGGDDMASKIAAIKAKMAGGAAPAAAAAPAAPAGAGASTATAAPAAGGEDVQARIAALKAKMDEGKGKPPATTAAKPKPAAKKAGGAKNIFPVQPVNRRTFGDERLYKPNTVNLWFAISSLVLTASVFMMWGRDYVRGWKPIQATFREREIQRLAGDVALANSAIDATELARVEGRLGELETQLADKQELLSELDAEVEELDGLYYASNQMFQIEKSSFDEMRYTFEEERLLHGDDSELLVESRVEMEELTSLVAELKLAADNALLALEQKKTERGTVLAEQTELTRFLDTLTEDRSKVELSLGKMGVTVSTAEDGTQELDRSLFHDYIRNAPVADMLSPTFKIDKIVLEKLRDNYNFMYVGRVDMCTTCHVAINKPAYSDWDPDNSKTDEGIPGERVLNAHPRLDLFMSDDSPHPMGEFGCTVCHLGKGQAVEFERTFHTPAADAYESKHEKEERWIRDYDYDPARHYWDWPMTSADMLYSSCWQCHQDTDRIAGVPEYNEPRALVEDLGCYGCHKIQGLEHLRKPGPDLTNIAAKTTVEWTWKWGVDPQGFRPTTRMPHFWNQSNTGERGPRIDPAREWLNNSDQHVDDWRARNDVEVRAVMAYIFDKSNEALAGGSYGLLPVPAEAGDPQAGQATFAQRGCLGCHSLTEDNLGGDGWDENTHGPELSRVGSKVNAQWLYNWILEPKKYFDTAVMPDLRLSEQEAWNITAYLMAQRDEAWEASATPRADQALVDQIAIENLASVAGEDWAAEQVAEMKASGGSAAVEVFVGGKLFARYGCSGCHLVPGHYDDVGVGTELTYEALKELSKFDFGHEGNHANPEAIGHKLEDWFRHKLSDPRVFDRMPVVADGPDGEPTIVLYEQKLKSPGEKLKMPNFYLDSDEISLVTQFLLGLREDGIDETMKARLSADEALIEDGSRLITKFNCTGCHRIGQLPRPVTIEGDDTKSQIASFMELAGEALEYGLWVHGDVSSGDQLLFADGAWLSDEFYDPEEEEDALIDEWFEDDPDTRPVPERLVVYGQGEGGMGKFIEESAMRPPVLRGQGDKTDPEWMFDFLVDPYIVRTHVEVRMPTFGLTSGESMALVRWFAAQADEPWPFELDTDAEPQDELLSMGREQFAFFQCSQCHPAGDQIPSNPDKANWGPDLALASTRLQLTWMHDWLWDPQEISPGSRMPNFLGEWVDGEYDALYDNYQERIDALLHYLKHMRDAEAMASN